MGFFTVPATPLRKPWSLPVRGFALFEGNREALRLSHYFLPGLIRKGRRILFLDGANSASPHLMARLARQSGISFEQFCRSVQIARAFTCFQLAELIARVPQFVASFPAQVLMVTAFPALYLDQDTPDWDARVAFERALRDLSQWSSRPQLSLAVAVFSSSVDFTAAYSRRNFTDRTRLAATEVWKFDHDEQGKPTLSLQPQFRRQRTVPRRMQDEQHGAGEHSTPALAKRTEGDCGAGELRETNDGANGRNISRLD